MFGTKFIFSLINWSLWIYWIYFLSIASLLLILTAAFRLTTTGSKLNFYLCAAILIFGFWLVPGLILPILVFRPRHWKNALITAWVLRKISYLAGFTWEIRGVRHAKEDTGAIICCNHQSELDTVGDINVGQVFLRRGTVAKKSLLYVFPLGLVSWLSNIVFIDRSNPKAAHQTLQNLVSQMRDEKMKFLFYPEGTTNTIPNTFLPFKRGAFLYAIKAQVPIIPMVSAPYYYVDWDNFKLVNDTKHNIISVLEPIPTKGLTENDWEQLKDKTHKVMFDEFLRLSKEVEVSSKDPEWLKKPRPRCTKIH